MVDVRLPSYCSPRPMPCSRRRNARRQGGRGGRPPEPAPSLAAGGPARVERGALGASPSGKAADFGSAIPRFESWRPNHSPIFRTAAPPTGTRRRPRPFGRKCGQGRGASARRAAGAARRAGAGPTLRRRSHQSQRVSSRRTRASANCSCATPASRSVPSSPSTGLRSTMTNRPSGARVMEKSSRSPS